MSKEVAKAASRALGLLIAKCKANGGMPYDTFTCLYNACVLPVLLYGAAVWGQREYSHVNAIHNRACKFFLGVNKCTPNAAAQGDMGWKTPFQHQWQNVTKHWTRLCNMANDRLSKKVFIWAFTEHGNRKHSWVSRCLSKFKEIDMEHLCHIGFDFNCKEVNKDMNIVLSGLAEKSWFEDINRKEAVRGSGGNKLRTYSTVKNQYHVEAYVKNIMPYPYRSALAKFRCGVAPIRIETGRYRRLAVHERLCFH
jgi:hypothetical protein